jgi:hypothetical protein
MLNIVHVLRGTGWRSWCISTSNLLQLKTEVFIYSCLYISNVCMNRPRQLTIWALCLVIIQKPLFFSSMEANLSCICPQHWRWPLNLTVRESLLNKTKNEVFAVRQHTANSRADLRSAAILCSVQRQFRTDISRQPTWRFHLQGSRSPRRLRYESLSVWNYHSTLRNIPEERWFFLQENLQKLFVSHFST